MIARAPLVSNTRTERGITVKEIDITGLPKYTLHIHEAGPFNPWPEPPTKDNTVSTLADAARWFKRNYWWPGVADVTEGDGYEGPFVDITLTADWDGISYGDCPLWRLTFGPRGGVIRESF